MASAASRPKILVVGAGAIGGVVAGRLLHAGADVTTMTTNAGIADALRSRGFQVTTSAGTSVVPAGPILTAGAADGAIFDVVLLATQPPQVEDAARSVLPALAPEGRMVCFQNGLCEHRVARIAGSDRTVGAIVAWGASMSEAGAYEKTSEGGFTVGRFAGAPDDRTRALAAVLDSVAPARLTDNLLGARWSKLAINCAISTLGTIGGDRLGPLLRHAFVRRLAAEIMTETARVANAEKVRLEKVANTIDLNWLALTDAERQGEDRLGLFAKHAVLIAAGLKYRRLRSSMLAAIERGRPPAVDFLNGEVMTRAMKHKIPSPVNAAARAAVWQISRGEARASFETLQKLYEETR